MKTVDFPIWIAIFLPLLIVLWSDFENRRKERQRMVIKQKQRNRKGGIATMSDILKRFIGKDCLITTMNTTVTGVVEAVEDNWLIFRKPENGGSDNDMVNVDYVSRIREYPVKKNGKRKLIVG